MLLERFDPTRPARPVRPARPAAISAIALSSRSPAAYIRDSTIAASAFN